MREDSVLEFRNPDPEFHDHVTEIIQTGCRQIIATALEAVQVHQFYALLSADMVSAV